MSRTLGMRSALLLCVVVAGCNKAPAPSAALTVEQHRALALAVPAGDADLARAAEAAKAAPALADRWVVLGQLWVRKARASSDPGQYLSAEGAAKVALSLQPKYSAALALEAIVALNQHRFTEARDTANAALVQRDDDLLALAALADATLELGDVTASAAAVQRMLDLKPNLPSYGRAAHLRWVLGDSAGAQQLYRRAIDAGWNPKDPEPQAWMAVQSSLLFLDEGDLDGALAGFDFALGRVPRYPPALAGKARVLLSRGDAAGAVSLLEQSLNGSPLVDTWVLLAEARAELKDTEGAVAAWSKAEALGRASDPLALARGWSEAGTHVREAVAMLTEERKLRPNLHVDGALAWALLKAGDVDAAVAASERALALGTSDARLRYQHAAIQAARGEREPALRELEALAPRVAALSPRMQREAKELLLTLKQQLAVK